MFQFSCRFAFLSTFRLSNRTSKITRILTLHQANEATLTGCNFFKQIPKLIIYGTHNLQTFINDTLVHELLLLQFYLFKLRVTLFTLSQLCQQPVDAVLRPTFIRKLCYKLPRVVTFTFIQTFDQNFVFFTERRHVDRQCDA